MFNSFATLEPFDVAQAANCDCVVNVSPPHESGVTPTMPREVASAIVPGVPTDDPSSGCDVFVRVDPLPPTGGGAAGGGVVPGSPPPGGGGVGRSAAIAAASCDGSHVTAPVAVGSGEDGDVLPPPPLPDVSPSAAVVSGCVAFGSAAVVVAAAVVALAAFRLTYHTPATRTIATHTHRGSGPSFFFSLAAVRFRIPFTADSL